MDAKGYAKNLLFLEVPAKQSPNNPYGHGAPERLTLLDGIWHGVF